MNKQQQEQRALWGEQAKEAVRQARDEEAARPLEDRKKTTKQEFVPQRAWELLKLESLSGAERDKKKWWVKKMVLGSRMYAQQRQEATVIAPRFEAWPVEREVPKWVTDRFAEQHWLWNALARPVQDTIKRIKDSIAAVYREAEAEGLDTKDAKVKKRVYEAARKNGGIDFSPLTRIERARTLVLGAADWHRKPKGKPAPKGTETWTVANWSFAKAVAKCPAYLQRVVKDRLAAASKARRTRRAGANPEAWDKGYPRPLEEWTREGGIDKYFEGQNRRWSVGEMKNSYVEISAPWNPPDHRGPRKGKYRSLREMRKVTLREPESKGQNRFSLNVLFHSVPVGALMKGYKLRAKRDANGKLRWLFIPTFELPNGSSAESRTFAGVDIGWRKCGEEEFTAVHFWDESHGFRSWELKIADNRWSRRYNARQQRLPANEQFLMKLTPAGLRDFASRKGALQRDFKARMAQVLEKRICAQQTGSGSADAGSCA